MINGADYLQTQLRLTLALGAKLNAGDATMEPIGYTGIHLLIKQFPHPKVSGGTEIEVAHPGGGSYYEQTPIDEKVTGGITFYETEAGTVQAFLKQVIENGGYFDCRIYEGTPERHIRSYQLERCFVHLDPTDRDWESRTQVLMLTGTFYGHYFGQEFQGNA